MQASNSICSTCSGADSDSSINLDDSSSSGDESVRVHEETTSEEPMSPVYLSLLSATARPSLPAKPHIVSSLQRQVVSPQVARQQDSGPRDGASAELSEEEMKEITSFKSKEETEEIAKLIESAFGKEMCHTYMAFEGNVQFFCSTIAAIMHPLFKQCAQIDFVLDVCQTAVCMEQYSHFALHLYDAVQLCNRIVDRVNLNSSKIVACMAGMRSCAAALAPAQDVAHAQTTIQKCQLILDHNGTYVAKVKHSVVTTRQSLQPLIALLKQKEASDTQRWPAFVCCEGFAAADSHSSINLDDSSSSGDESVRVHEQTTLFQVPVSPQRSKRQREVA
jgi:hypothetical protein